MKILKTLWNDESGATAIEYGLIAALVSVAAVATLQTMGTDLSSVWSTVSTEVKKGTSGSGG